MNAATINTNEATLVNPSVKVTKSRKHLLGDHPIIFSFAAKIFLMALMLVSIRFIPINSSVGDFINTLLPIFILAIIVKARYGKELEFGFRLNNTLTCFRLCTLYFIGSAFFILINLLTGETPVSTQEGLTFAITTSIAAGVYEEIFYRAIICNNMMRVWKDRKGGMYAAAVVSALVFGVSHLSNGFLTGFTSGLVSQIIFATAAGTLFGAIYLRTRNLWGLITVHTIWDLSGFLFTDFSELTAEAANISTEVANHTADAFDITAIAFDIVIMVITLVISAYVLRPSKHAEIKALWNN